MRISCERKDLFEGVQTVNRIVSARNTLPILSHILLQTVDNHLRLVGTDFGFETTMEVGVPATVMAGGSVTVPCRAITHLIEAFPDSEVSLSADENNVVQLNCLRSEYLIRGLPAQDFPKLPEVEGGRSVTIEQALLKRLVAETVFAASADETRAHLETRALLIGALTVLGNGTVKMVATDTHRLAVSTVPAPGITVAGAEDPAGEGVIIPARVLRELARVLTDEAGPTIEVRTTRNQVLFRTEDFLLVSRLIDGQFPHFERLIPKEARKRLVLNTRELLAVLRRAISILPRDSANRVVFRTGTEGLLDITAEAGELGRAHEQVEATCEGGAVEIAFNGRYVIDMLSITDADSVVIELTDSLHPGVVKPAPTGEEPEGRSYLYLLMPMALPAGE